MRYAKGTHLDHKEAKGFMFVVQDFDPNTNEYFGELYQKTAEPLFITFSEQVLNNYYQPTTHQFKVGDRFKRLISPDGACHVMEITKLLYAGRYRVTTMTYVPSIGERVDGDSGVVNDDYLHAFGFHHENPTPPPPTGCQHELVDIGVRHTRLVCKHCDYENK